MTDDSLRSHVEKNRALWDSWAPEWFDRGGQGWAGDALWGIHGIPESEAQLLATFSGGRVIDLGCGTGYVSAWLSRMGGDPIGVDNSSAQLSSARRLQHQFDLHFPLVHGDAEHLPFADQSFDFAISEYGAAIWCDPYRWIPEAARVLRSGGRLVFLGNSTQLMLCVPDDDGAATTELLRPQFGMHRFEWDDDPGVEFHLSHGEMIKVLRTSGFEIEDLIELRPPAQAEENRYPFVDLEWANRWPAEEAWIVRKH
jgi:SAM-dependent methyltransferase